jgi:hypothetical protein
MRRRGYRGRATARAHSPCGTSIDNLQSLLDCLEAQRPDSAELSVGALFDAVGRRAFGAALILPGLFVLSPLGGIPGATTVAGLTTVLLSLPVVFKRRGLWLPAALRRRQIARHRLLAVTRAMRRPARFIDRLLRPRLEWVMRGVMLQSIAAIIVAIGLTMPLLELVPFADTVPGAAIVVFGLALTSHDGLLALLTAALCAIALALLFGGAAAL